MHAPALPVEVDPLMARAAQDPAPADVVPAAPVEAPAPEPAPAPVCTVRFNGRLWSVVVDGVQVTTASTWTKGAAYVRHHYGVELTPPAEQTDSA